MAGIKFKGAVLLESMIAMIIVMLCFGLGVMIFTNVTSGSRNSLAILARARINTEEIRTKEEKRYIDEDIFCGEFTIKKRITPYLSYDKIFLLQYSAVMPDHKILAGTHELIYP